jgi:hypothetical protein
MKETKSPNTPLRQGGIVKRGIETITLNRDDDYVEVDGQVDLGHGCIIITDVHADVADAPPLPDMAPDDGPILDGFGLDRGVDTAVDTGADIAADITADVSVDLSPDGSADLAADGVLDVGVDGVLEEDA